VKQSSEVSVLVRDTVVGWKCIAIDTSTVSCWKTYVYRYGWNTSTCCCAELAGGTTARIVAVKLVRLSLAALWPAAWKVVVSS